MINTEGILRRLKEEKDNVAKPGVDKALAVVPRQLPYNFTVTVTLHYLNPSLAGKRPIINAAKLSELKEAGTVVAKKMDIAPMTHRPTLSENGFEVHTIPQHFVVGLSNLDKCMLTQPFDADTLTMIHSLQRKMEVILESHFSNVEVICVDAVYRNTDTMKANPFRQINFVHVDFSQGCFAETLHCFQPQWEPFFEKRGMPYSSDNMVDMMNVWMPLDTVIAHPLVLHNKTDNLAKRFAEYLGVRRDSNHFVAKSLLAPISTGESPWRYLPLMGLGDGYLFRSQETPHSAANIPFQHDSSKPSRRSVEMRCLFFRKKTDPVKTEPQGAIGDVLQNRK